MRVALLTSLFSGDTAPLTCPLPEGERRLSLSGRGLGVRVKLEDVNRAKARRAAPGEARGLLRALGKRITAQRALLLQIIQESEGHLDAEELYRRARRHDPRLNLATVYRTLNLLKDSNLIEQRYFARNHHREQFESKARPAHYHFTCRRCGKVIEFESPLVEQLRADVRRRFGVEFTHGCLCFEGYCADCVDKTQ